jgi:hypothetical protein
MPRWIMISSHVRNNIGTGFLPLYDNIQLCVVLPDVDSLIVEIYVLISVV